MAKPMLVTLPLVLLLLDFWPLARFRAFPPARLLLEKAPLLALAAASAAVTLRAQADSVVAAGDLPAVVRVANAAVSAVAYLGKMLWPSPLAVFYPILPGGPGIATALAALLALAGVTAAAALLARRAPALLAGWGWYLVALVPVLGIVQVGGQAMADRYTYLPSVGVGIAAVWSLAGLARRRRALAAPLLALSAALLLAWGAVTVRTVALWRDGVTLFGHALAVTRLNGMAHFALGGELARLGRLDESIEEFRAAAALRPDLAGAWFDLGVSLLARKDAAGATDAFREALRRQPAHAGAHNNLGIILARAGQVSEAAAEFRAALRARPDFEAARTNLARAEALLLRQAAAPGREAR
jgi:tetratricopeptide (TPR) repeat protein